MSEREHSLERIIRSRFFQTLLAAARMALGAMFVYAGVTKIIDPAGFAMSVYNYHLLPGWLVNITAIMLPWVEVAAGTSLVLGLWTQGGALITAGLLLVFTLALGFNLSRGLDIACGCFSTSASGEPITWWYLLRDSSLLGASLLVLFYEQGFLSLEHMVLTLRRRSQ
ncbi:MAG TPA: MauE/DoxX family redox-associated membrane protein [Syntrophorhabdus sp.]|nr:MauE/DoxX family redox-associated membrane protein [Syntrophorhabdus sp.]